MAPPLTSKDSSLCMPLLAASMTAAVCAEAQAFDEKIQSIRENVERAVSFSSIRDQCFQELVETIAECSVAAWDGYDALAVNREAALRAKQFIGALPTDYPFPEVGVMPDGEICLDWDLGARRTLTVAIGSQQRLAYAMINADEERSGTLSFMNEVPPSLLQVISELYMAG